MKTILRSLLLLFVAFNSFSQTTESFNYDGLTRQYIEYVPSTYDGSQPVPVVLWLHGLGDNMNNFSNMGMQNIADTANFIVLTPEAIADPNYGTAWNSGASYMNMVLNANIDDIGFLNALLDTTIERYNIDINNIFASGFSMGGFMTNRLSCESTDRFQAAASVSGTIGNSLTCSASEPIPFCHFHGTADATVKYTNNDFGNDAEPLVDYWVGVNNCNTTPIVDTLPDLASDGRRVVHFDYPNGDNNTNVEFYKIINGEHDWMYLPNFDISYTLEIWRFFLKNKNPITMSSTNEISIENIVNLFPNPAQSNVNIISNNKITNCQIINTTGKIIKHININANNFSINTSNFKKGTYFVKLISNKETTVKKLLIY